MPMPMTAIMLAKVLPMPVMGPRSNPKNLGSLPPNRMWEKVICLSRKICPAVFQILFQTIQDERVTISVCPGNQQNRLFRRGINFNFTAFAAPFHLPDLYQANLFQHCKVVCQCIQAKPKL